MMEFKKRKILIVDDDPGFLEMAQSYFHTHQYETVGAKNPQEAISAMQEGRFKVVILDYQLPLMKGDDLIACLQQINPSARFIIITGVLSEDVEDKFKGLGYYAYFEKSSLQLKKLEEAVLNAYED